MAKRWDPAKFAAKYKARASSAAADYAKGCADTDKDPTELAAAAAPKYEARLQESFGRQSFQKGLRKAGKSKWQKGVKDKGEANYRTGVNAGAANLQDYYNGEGAAVYQQIAAKMASMPNLTEADADARSAEAIKILREFGKKRRGG